ncbi:MAG: adenosylmethionine decarboxylase [Candidatus Hodarchaeales archaeon]
MFGEPNEFTWQIAQKSKLREGSDGIDKIIRQLYRNQDHKLTNKEFAKLVGIPVPVVSAVRGELIKAEFLKTKNILSSKAISWIEKELGLRFDYSFFQGFSPSSPSISNEHLSFFKPIIDALDDRPPPEYKYDQTRSTTETVLKRALIMARNGDVEGRKIVLLGDDDGLSMALAHLDCAREIVVIDIDSRILKVIEDFSKRNNYSTLIRTHLWDIRTAFPKEWLNYFDTFEMDPPYTVSGFKLFVSRALSLINPSSTSHGYISFGNKSPFEKWECQEHLNTNGLVIEEFIPNFNSYIGATILGSSSNLYIVGSIPQKVFRTELPDQTQAIYTFDEKKVKDLPTVGYQIIAELYGVSNEILTNVTLLKEIASLGLEHSQLHAEEVFLKEYSPYGLSVIFILVESHCHIHTWPEHNYLSLDLFVCEAKEKAETFFHYLLKRINPVDYHKFQFYRGRPQL